MALDALLVDGALQKLLVEVVAQNCARDLAQISLAITDLYLRQCAIKHFVRLANVCARWKAVLNINPATNVAAALWLLSALDRTTRYVFESRSLEIGGEDNLFDKPQAGPNDKPSTRNGENAPMLFVANGTGKTGWAYRVNYERSRIYKHSLTLIFSDSKEQPRAMLFGPKEELMVNPIANFPVMVNDPHVDFPILRNLIPHDLGFYATTLTAGCGANVGYFYVVEACSSDTTPYVLLVRKLRLDNGAPADDEYRVQPLSIDDCPPRWKWYCGLQSSGDGTRLLCQLRVRRYVEFYAYPCYKPISVRYWWLLDTRDGSVVYSYRACPQLHCDSDLKDDLHFSLSRDSLLTYRVYGQNTVCFRLKSVPLRDIDSNCGQRFDLSKNGFKSVTDAMVDRAIMTRFANGRWGEQLVEEEEQESNESNASVWTYCNCQEFCKPHHGFHSYPHYTPFFFLHTSNNDRLFLARPYECGMHLIDVANKRARRLPAQPADEDRSYTSYTIAAFEFGNYTMYCIKDPKEYDLVDGRVCRMGIKYRFIPKITRVPLSSWR